MKGKKKLYIFGYLFEPFIENWGKNVIFLKYHFNFDDFFIKKIIKFVTKIFNFFVIV